MLVANSFIIHECFGCFCLGGSLRTFNSVLAWFAKPNLCFGKQLTLKLLCTTVTLQCATKTALILAGLKRLKPLFNCVLFQYFVVMKFLNVANEIIKATKHIDVVLSCHHQLPKSIVRTVNFVQKTLDGQCVTAAKRCFAMISLMWNYEALQGG